jgi:hypothetical protein
MESYLTVSCDVIQKEVDEFKKAKYEFENLNLNFITKKTNLESIYEYSSNESEVKLLDPYKLFLDDEKIKVDIKKDIYNNKRKSLLEFKDNLRFAITELTNLFNEIDNLLLQAGNESFCNNNDNTIINSMKHIIQQNPMSLYSEKIVDGLSSSLSNDDEIVTAYDNNKYNTYQKLS